MMKKATNNKAPKSVTEEKEKRKSVPADSPKATAAPPAKEAKSKTPKMAPSPLPPDTTAKPATSRRKRGEASGSEARAKAGRPPRSKSFGFNDELIQDFVADADAVSEELDDELALDPMELPLELLDPELVEVPRPSPQPKPKPVTSRRQQSCASCGNTFAWLSVDQLCFNCLKKKLAQRKREDETYPGFTGEAEEEEDVS